MSSVKSDNRIDKLRKANEQLKVEISIERIRISEAATS